MRYVINTNVKRLEERFECYNWRKDEQGNSTCDRRSLGWWVTFQGSWEAMYMGSDKPEFQAGQKVRIIIEEECTPES